MIKGFIALASCLSIASITMADSEAPDKPTPANSPRGDALQLLFDIQAEPALLELRVEINGTPVPHIWDETFEQLFSFYDRDANGVLDASEAGRLPATIALRQSLWGHVTPRTGVAPSFLDLDLDRSEMVEPGELADYYRRTGLGGVLVGLAEAPSTDALTDAILSVVNSNNDATVSESEWLSAPNILRKIDSNDDELVGPGELIEGTTYPGVEGTILLTVPTLESSGPLLADTLPFIVLPLRSADREWVPIVSARRKEKGFTELEDDALLARHGNSPIATWSVRIDKERLEGGEIEQVGCGTPSNDRLVFELAGQRLVLRSDESKLSESVATACKRYDTAFAAADTNADGLLASEELGALESSLLKALATTADRNSDGTLSHAELSEWVDLQRQVAEGHALLTVIDHGRGLFELLDVDHDGGLSVRELRTAYECLKTAGCVVEGHFDRTKLPRQLLASISRGHPRSSPGKPTGNGPKWFVAMDRNGDGDVSEKEFTGPIDAFEQLDVDNDGLLAALEVERDADPD